MEGKEGRQLAGVALDSGTKGALPSLDGCAGQKRRKEPAALLFSLDVLPPFSLLGRILAMDL